MWSQTRCRHLTTIHEGLRPSTADRNRRGLQDSKKNTAMRHEKPGITPLSVACFARRPQLAADQSMVGNERREAMARVDETIHELGVNGAANPTPRTGEPEAPARTSGSERFRRLKRNEVVSHGDFVADERLGLQPWEGPGGFRADAFVRPIYRRKETEKSRPTATPGSKREAASSA